MLVLDNIIFSLQRAGGISTVWENMIRGIYGNIYLKCLEYPGALDNIHRSSLDIEDKDIIRFSTKSLLLEQMSYPDLSALESSIFHSSFYRICDKANTLNITTVHDFIYELAYKHRSLSQFIRSRLNHRAIQKSDHIVCISENTKRDLLKLIPEVANKPIYVIYNGVSDEYFQLPEKNERYSDCLLFVGGRQGYKNFDFAVEMAVASNSRLLICGNALNDKETSLLYNKLGQSGYEFILCPSNEELNLFYNSVKALIYPSSYEGFGIPILEAQRAGCPVLALNTSSIPEVIGETPLLLQYLDETSFKRALKILDNNSETQNIIEAGLVNSQRFSWGKMAKEYLELYRSLI